MLHQGSDVRHSADGEPPGQRGLGSVFRRDEQRPDPRFPGRQRHGQNAGDAPHRAGEGQLPQKGGVRRRRREFSGGGQQPHKDGKVVDRACLLLPCRRQVHGDTADRELGAAVFYCRPDPFPGLPDCCVRQSHDVKGRQPAGEKTLGPHLISRDAVQSQGTYGYDHPSSPQKNIQHRGIFKISLPHKDKIGNPFTPKAANLSRTEDCSIRNSKICAKNNKAIVYRREEW